MPLSATTLPLPGTYSAIYPPSRYTEATLPLPADFSSGMQGGMLVRYLVITPRAACRAA